MSIGKLVVSTGSFLPCFKLPILLPMKLYLWNGTKSHGASQHYLRWTSLNYAQIHEWTQQNSSNFACSGCPSYIIHFYRFLQLLRFGSGPVVTEVDVVFLFAPGIPHKSSATDSAVLANLKRSWVAPPCPLAGSYLCIYNSSRFT